MAQSGSGGKGVGKIGMSGGKSLSGGLGSGRNGLKRLQRKIFDGSSALSKPSLRRLARRAGVKRINAGVYDEAPIAMRFWLAKMVRDAATFAEHARRMTITINDILMALKRNGITLYGFTMTEKRRRLSRPLPRHSLAAAAQRVATRNTTFNSPPASAAPAAQIQLTTVRRTRQTAPEETSAPMEVIPERAQDIQVALAAYRDTEVARKSRSDAPFPTVLEWINGHMLGRNKTACSGAELDVVLEALEEQDAVMVTSDDATRQRLVWFVA